MHGWVRHAVLIYVLSMFVFWIVVSQREMCTIVEYAWRTAGETIYLLAYFWLMLIIGAQYAIIGRSSIVDFFRGPYQEFGHTVLLAIRNVEVCRRISAVLAAPCIIMVFALIAGLCFHTLEWSPFYDDPLATCIVQTSERDDTDEKSVDSDRYPPSVGSTK